MKLFRNLLLLLALFSSTASAHQDRILKVQPDGSIPDVPASLGPVWLNVSGLGSATPTVQFRSGTHTNKVPACVTRFIRSKTKSDLFVTGSWYHKESVLPYYISVQFLDPGHVASRPYNSSTNILFNLRTAEVIHVKRFTVSRSGSGGRYVKLDLPKGCLAQERAA